MKLAIPLKLRDVLIDTEVHVNYCSSACLLKTRELIYAVPSGLGYGVDGKSAISNSLFETSSKTLIKIVKVQPPSVVLENLGKIKNLVGIGGAVACCECALEIDVAPGSIIEIIDSVHYRSLAAKYVLFKFTTQVEILNYFTGAVSIISNINKHGYAHGDPAYWNFLFDGTRVQLIDLEEIRPIDDSCKMHQTMRFVEFLVAPIMRLALGKEINLRLISIAVESGILPFNAAELQAVVDISNRANESSLQHFQLSAKLAHLTINHREAKRTYERHISGLREEVAQLSLQLTAPTANAMTHSAPVGNDGASHRQLVEKESIIQQLLVDHTKSQTELIEKEEVIRALANAVSAYRLAYTAIKPIGMLLSPFSLIVRHGRAMLRPRLGNLNQYPPQVLTQPKTDQRIARLSATPKISIVTPSFRQGAFIEKTLLSVFEQQYPNLEYFVQDGGSKDSTVAILEKHKDKLAGWESEDDSGQSQAINRGFAKTSGEIMAWLNSDDLLLPGTLATVADYFNRHPEVDVLYGNRLLIDENDMEIGRWIMPGHDSAALSWVDYVPQETLFWRRRIWDKVGGQIDESFRFAMDWDLLVRFRDAGAKFAHIPRFMGAFRIHQHQKTSANINDIGHQEMDRIRKRVLGRVPSRKEIRNAALPYLLKHIAVDLAYRTKKKLKFQS